jgi:hypothetical protein
MPFLVQALGNLFFEVLRTDWQHGGDTPTTISAFLKLTFFRRILKLK